MKEGTLRAKDSYYPSKRTQTLMPMPSGYDEDMDFEKKTQTDKEIRAEAHTIEVINHTFIT